jgi:hypothetical protein
MIALAEGHRQVVDLLQKRDRYFDYAVRYEKLSAAVKRIDLKGILGGLWGGFEYWAFCLRMVGWRAVNRLQRMLRRPAAKRQRPPPVSVT